MCCIGDKAKPTFYLNSACCALLTAPSTSARDQRLGKEEVRVIWMFVWLQQRSQALEIQQAFVVPILQQEIGTIKKRVSGRW